jgi:chromosome partitioning protein
MINMKGGVGKTTLTFNLAWYAAWRRNLRVLAVDLDPQANLSQYFMGAEGYVNYINEGNARCKNLSPSTVKSTRSFGISSPRSAREGF